jgi:hypothetical protein
METTQETVEQTGFAEALSPDKPEAPEPKPAEAPESKPEEPQPEPVEVPAEAPKEEPEPVQDQLQRERDGILKALQSERQKRQELEAAIQQQRNQTQEVDYYDTSDLGDQVKKLKAELRNEQKLLATQMSEQMARKVYPDYDEKFKVFGEAVNHNPELLDVVMNSDNPAEAAYRTGQEILFKNKYGSEESQIKAAIRKEVYADVKKEVEADIAKRLEGRANQPTSISGVRAASGSEKTEWSPGGWADKLGR